MRRFDILLPLMLALIAVSAATAQTTLWSPCGCPEQGCAGQCQSCNTGGCSNSGQPCCLGLGTCCADLKDPAYFQPWTPRPFGSFNDQIMNLQRSKGISAQQVFYQFDFEWNEATGYWTLSKRGVNDARKIAQLWSLVPSRVLVEPSGRDDWDGVRRNLALQALMANGVSCTENDVVVGTSPVLGLVPNEPGSIFDRRNSLSPYMQGYLPSSSIDTGGVPTPSTSNDSAGTLPNN